jgi:hypothetical protein
MATNYFDDDEDLEDDIHYIDPEEVILRNVNRCPVCNSVAIINEHGYLKCLSCKLKFNT